MNLKEKIGWKYRNFVMFHYPYLWAKHLYKENIGKVVDFSHPCDINEKIQWLEFFTDTTSWSILADKYAVREYVAKRVGEQYLVPLLGKWDKAEDIDFSALPQKFVMKPNNGSYDCVVVKEKNKVDIEEIRKRMDLSLHQKFGYVNAEPHYLRIRPCIIAEQLLETDEAGGLVDYKIWCFNGAPYSVLICMNRNPVTHHADLIYYDLQWNRHPNNISEPFRNDASCTKPSNLDEMLDIAHKLSKGLPQARVDLYNIKGKIFFGEITLTSNFGMMPYYTQDVLDEMGKLCILPNRTMKERIKTFYYRWFPII